MAQQIQSPEELSLLVLQGLERNVNAIGRLLNAVQQSLDIQVKLLARLDSLDERIEAIEGNVKRLKKAAKKD